MSDQRPHVARAARVCLRSDVHRTMLPQPLPAQPGSGSMESPPCVFSMHRNANHGRKENSMHWPS